MTASALITLAGEAFRKTLWYELWKAGLIPDAAQYQATYAEVMRLGKVEYKEIRTKVGTLTWWRGLVSVGQPSPIAVQRILGWGRLLTEYFIAPVPLAGAQRSSIAKLGALENLIVTLYDSLVDWRSVAIDALPRAALESAIHGREPFAEAGNSPQMSISSVILMRLAAEYFARLNHLSGSSKNQHVRTIVDKSILTMYDAERTLLSSHQSPNLMIQKRMLIRTSACPFVVMGLPAWLAIPQIDLEQYVWHMRWLYRLGQFCAWVDHSVDLDFDVASHRINLVANELSDIGEDSRAALDLAYRIASDGARLVDEWDRRICAVEPLPSTLRTTIQTCVASWFGGVPAAWG